MANLISGKKEQKKGWREVEEPGGGLFPLREPTWTEAGGAERDETDEPLQVDTRMLD